MLWRSVRLGMLVALLMIMKVGSAQAAFIVYGDESTWAAAVAALGSGVVVEDFTDATLIAGLTTANGTISGGTFNALANTQFNDAGNPRLNFSPGTLAVGGTFDLSPGGAGDGLSFVVNGAITAFAPGTYSGFVGFISDDATTITSLRFDSPGTGTENFALDNLSIASGTPSAPEPSLLLLVTAGALAGARRARRKLG
jgi:hypothetical protein